MAVEVLRREAEARAARTGETFEVAHKAVLETKAGQQLEDLRDGPHHGESAEHWQEDIARQRDMERNRSRHEERKLAERAVDWERFIKAERRDLELRKDGQLAALLGEPLQGELPAQLRMLVSEDQRQAEQGLVALMSGGKVSFKRLNELVQEDLPARIAANRLRTAWLKERLEVWGGGQASRGLGDL